MTATPDTISDVLHTIEEQHPSWPQTPKNPGNSWPLVWDAAVFVNRWFNHDDHNNLEEAILNYPLNPQSFEYGAARWHRNTKPPVAMLKAQLIRLSKGYEHQKDLHEYLSEHSDLVDSLGFDSLPSRSTLWSAWNKHLSTDNERISLRIIANTFIKIAREHDVPAPAPAFHPELNAEEISKPNPADPSLREYTKKKTKEIWKDIAPFVHRSYNRCFDREDNASIDAATWWEAHAYLAPKQDTYTESGLDDYEAETTRENVQCGRYHRDKLRNIGTEEIRRRHRQATENILDRARQKGELDRPTIVSLDITKSSKPICKLDSVEGWDPDPKECNVTSKWILGYDDSDMGKDPDINYYFQWAGIRTTGLSHPCILDGVPVYREMPRHEIVDELLKYSTDMVDIDLLLVDREFDTDKIKAVCLKHGVNFLNPERMLISEKATCSRLRRERKRVHIEEKTVNVSDEFLEDILGEQYKQMTGDEVEEMMSYKRVYVPAKKKEMWESQVEKIESEATDPSTDEPKEDATSNIDPQSVGRPELWTDFATRVLDSDLEPEPNEQPIDDDEDSWMFEDFTKELKEEEKQLGKSVGNKKDKQLYALFATDHPDFPEFDAETDEEKKVNAVERFLSRYGTRWDIEENWKYVRVFRVNTKSRDHQYRFFNFMFGCTLYNVWKIVDLLAKLSYYDDPPDDSIVRRNLLLVYAKKYFGRGLFT